MQIGYRSLVLYVYCDMSRPYVRPDSSRKSARQVPTRLNQQELDNSCHRLSRIAQKYAAPQPSRPEPSQGYAVEFFRTNPDVPVDKRSPTDKLEEIESVLQGDLEDQERFNLLVQRKSLCFLAFGENSRESVRALSELARFYNSQNRPESALRHIAKAQQISDGLEPESGADGLALAIEIADANLQSKHASRQEGARQVNAADGALSPYADAVIEDPGLAYRRDLLLARIKARKRNFRDAFVMYENAVKSLGNLSGGVATATTASLYMEMGTTAEQAKDEQRAGLNFLKAYRTFVALKMPESAKMIESKLPANADAVSEEETESDAPLSVAAHPPEPVPEPQDGESKLQPTAPEADTEGSQLGDTQLTDGDAASAQAASHGNGDGGLGVDGEEEEEKP
jgi:hypothetical protein